MSDTLRPLNVHQPWTLALKLAYRLRPARADLTRGIHRTNTCEEHVQMAQVPLVTATFCHRSSAPSRTFTTEINTAAAAVDVSGRELVPPDAQVVGSMGADAGFHRRVHRMMWRGDLDLFLAG